jgi:hypothetical protein
MGRTADLPGAELDANVCSHLVPLGWRPGEHRPRILEDDPELTCSLDGLVPGLLDQGEVSARARRELDQVHFLVWAMGPVTVPRAHTKGRADG